MPIHRMVYTDAQLNAVGLFALFFGQLESMARTLILESCGHPWTNTKILLGLDRDPTFGQAWSILDRVLQANLPAVRQATLAEVVSRGRNLLSIRNELFHSSWSSFRMEGDEEEYAGKEADPESHILFGPKSRHTPESLIEAAAECAEITGQILALAHPLAAATSRARETDQEYRIAARRKLLERATYTCEENAVEGPSKWKWRVTLGDRRKAGYAADPSTARRSGDDWLEETADALVEDLVRVHGNSALALKHLTGSSEGAI